MPDGKQIILLLTILRTSSIKFHADFVDFKHIKCLLKFSEVLFVSIVRTVVSGFKAQQHCEALGDHSLSYLTSFLTCLVPAMIVCHDLTTTFRL